MPRPLPWPRLLLSAFMVVGVILFVFLGLVLVGALDFWWGLAAALIIILVQTLVVRNFLGGVETVATALETVIADLEGPLPAIRSSSPMVNELWLGILRLNRAYRQRLRRLESALAGSDHLLDALPEPILLLNQQRETVRMNEAAHQLFGREALGRDLAVAVRNPSLLNAADAALRGGAARIIDFDMTLSVDQHLRAHLQALPDHPDAGYALLLSFTNLTSLKRAEQMRADFVANASHEIKTPLASLLGFIETIQGPAADDPEAQVRFLTIMHQQATRMSRLVDDLLSLSRIELNEHLPPTSHIQAAQILATVLQGLELRAKTRNITFTLDIDDPLPPVIADPDELMQVLQNLLDNAIKYARKDTSVAVSIKPSTKLRPGIAFIVRDQGEGIARVHLPRLTERFYRVDTARSRAMGGTGLGLAIVKHIINRHRGILEIDSELGDGSTFTVHLRVAVPVLPP